MASATNVEIFQSSLMFYKCDEYEEYVYQEGGGGGVKSWDGVMFHYLLSILRIYMIKINLWI